MIRADAIVAAIACASAGCAQLAGIDSTSTDGRAVDTLAIQRVSIGTTLAARPLDLSGLEATYFVDDDGATTEVAAEVAEPGTWRADLAEPAPVLALFPDEPTQTPRLYAFAQRALRTTVQVLEHPNPTAPPPGALLTITTPLQAASTMSHYQVYVVGAWGMLDLDASAVGASAVTANLGWSGASRVTGAPLDRITAQDAVLMLRYDGARLSGYAEVEPFEQTGADSKTTGALTAVDAKDTVNATVDPAVITTRLALAQPAATAAPVMSWSLVAAPGYLQAVATGPVLDSGSFTASSLGFMSTYGNPFADRGWKTLLAFAAASSRTYTAPNGAVVGLAAGLVEYREPAATVAPALTAPMPTAVRLVGTPLTAEGISIALPASNIEVAFDVEPGAVPATLYNLHVIDLVPGAADASLVRKIVLTAASDQRRFVLPADTFVAGHTYTLRVFSQVGGYPNAADGDFQTRALPLAQAYLDSGVFTVTQ